MTRIPISIEVRCLRIPAKWVMREDRLREELNLVPVFDRDAEGHVQGKIEKIAEPWELRDKFFRMKHEETAAIEFLNEVGVWSAVKDKRVPEWARAAGLELSGAFGYQFFFGWAQPITFEQLWRHQEHWRTLLLNPKNLRKEFGPAPPEDAAPFEKVDFAMKADFQNSLSIHMEWQRKRPDSKEEIPSGVVQPITFRELLNATTHVDLLSRARFYVCQRPDCAIPFTGRKRKFCEWYCGHITDVRKRREVERKRREREKTRGKKK